MKNSLFRTFAAWHDECCAEHDGSIASFESLAMKLTDPSEYARIFKRQSINVVRAGKYAGYAAAGIVVVGGVVVTAGTAGPVAAAFGKLGVLGAAGTGTAISSLSGGALTSASLAAIGGTVATGIKVITATGAALGGIQGAVLGNKYHSDDPSFAIRKLNQSESQHRTIFINGFTEQANESFDEWRDQQLGFDANQQLYGVNWSSKTRRELSKAFAQGAGSKVLYEMLKRAASSAAKKGPVKLNPIYSLFVAGGLMGNPWHTTMMRAGTAGAQLADALSRTEGATYTLVGHSLGCRVIYYALEALATKHEKFVNNVVLLGGAVGRSDAQGWQRAESGVRGRIFNCYSRRDAVLSNLYRLANVGLSDPVGLNPIVRNSEKIVNIDASQFVDSHFAWKPQYSQLVRTIRERYA